MAVSVLLGGGFCHARGMELEDYHLADFSFTLEAVVDRSGSHNLTQEALDRFLARLDPDRERAGVQYRNLHRKLVKLFECRGASCAESLADETIDRVIRKLDQVDIHDVRLYVLGVAQNVLKESWHSSTKNTSLETVSVRVLRVDPDADEQQKNDELEAAKRLECLDRCMRTLPRKERRLVMGYYEKHKSEAIQHRRKLAEQCGISLGTLRVQAHRIRCKLAAWVEKCLAGSA